MTASPNGTRKPGSELNLFGELAVSLRGMVSDEEFYTFVANLAHNKELLEQVINLVFGKSIFSFSALVNYDCPIEDKNAALLESGRVIYVSDAINFPLNKGRSVELAIDRVGERECQFKLIRFGRDVYLNMVRSEFRKDGFHLACFIEAAYFIDRNFDKLEELRRKQPKAPWADDNDRELLIAVPGSIFRNPETQEDFYFSFTMSKSGFALNPFARYSSSVSEDCFFLSCED